MLFLCNFGVCFPFYVSFSILHNQGGVSAELQNALSLKIKARSGCSISKQERKVVDFCDIYMCDLIAVGFFGSPYPLAVHQRGEKL